MAKISVAERGAAKVAGIPIKVEPSEFEELASYGYKLGFLNMASGPMIRSSYHADMQVKAKKVD